MAKEISPVGQAAIDLLNAQGAAFEEETTEAARTQFAVQRALDEQVESRIVLGNEAIALIDHMRWLNRHRWLGRLMTGSVQIVLRKYGGLETTPMFPGEPEYVIEGDQSNYVHDYYTFAALSHVRMGKPFYPFNGGYAGEPSREMLYIERSLVGEDPETASWAVENWAISLKRNEQGRLIEVGFNSTQTEEYKLQSYQRINEKYQATNPWLEDYRNISENTETPIIKKDIIGMASKVVANWDDPPPPLYARGLPRGESERRQAVIENLEHELTRGVGWDYDDEAYVFPLGLTLKAQKALGQEHALSKLMK